MTKYGLNSVCPNCNNQLAFNSLQRGFRIKCTKCRFKVYPVAIEQIEQELLDCFYGDHLKRHIDAARSRLHNCRSSLRSSDSLEQEE